MDFFTHLIISFLVARLFLEDFGLLYIIFVTFMGILPDLDVFWEFIPQVRKSKFFSHKGVSHSLVGALAVSLLFSTIFNLFLNIDFLILWAHLFLFYNIHILFDFLTASKIPIFYPISKKKLRYFIDRAVNLFLVISTGIIISLIILLYFITFPFFISQFYIIFLVYYLIYFTHRFLTKLYFQLKLPENCKYIPGIYPIEYYILELKETKSEYFFTLYRKIQFSKKKTIQLKSVLNKNTNEMGYYQTINDLSKNYNFFTKWDARFPLIFKKNDYIEISLFLAETYHSGTAYALTAKFDRNSGKLLDYDDGFVKVFQT